jgi:hypothetical protein
LPLTFIIKNISDLVSQESFSSGLGCGLEMAGEGSDLVIMFADKIVLGEYPD